MLNTFTDNRKRTSSSLACHQTILHMLTFDMNPQSVTLVVWSHIFTAVRYTVGVPTFCALTYSHFVYAISQRSFSEPPQRKVQKCTRELCLSVFPQVKTREMLKVYYWNSVLDSLLMFVDTFQMLLKFDKITGTFAWRPTTLLISLNFYRSGKITHAFYSVYNTLFPLASRFSQWLNTSEWAFWYYYAECSYCFALLYSAVKNGLSNTRQVFDLCISA
jgi:hypothetical protein